jgi:hypothetical protein
MSEALPDRVRRAFRQHDAVTDPADGSASVTSTAFDATLTASERDDGHIEFSVEVQVPLLSTVTPDEMAEVVADGWADTFRRRVENIGAVTEGDHDLEPTVSREADTLRVEAILDDLDHTRGTNDAVAVVDYVEGTYVQGVIPGYEYEPPVSNLIETARAAGGSDGL